MGKNLKGKELGKGVTQREDGDYCARYVDCNGKRIQRRFKTLAECKNWLAKCNQSVMINQSKGIQDMPVQDWYQIWIEMKEKQLVRQPLTIISAYIEMICSLFLVK